jgi:15-cis-phytoene synthase
MPASTRAEAFATPADCAACRASIRQGSKSFHLASLLLPSRVREPAYAVYAFCRMADDLIDRDHGGADAVARLHRMLDRIYAGRPGADHVERAFADVAFGFSIPRAIPEALVEGLAWDAEGRRYETQSDLVDYAVRVAGTVGVMMTLVMGRRQPDVLARACDLGIAMQLTNICRDVGEDADEGRIYLPLAMLRRAGVPADAASMRAHGDRVRPIVGDLLALAELHYDRAISGIAALPGGSRTGIAAARLLYREIGQEILRGVDPLTRRAVTSRSRKLALMARSLLVQKPAGGLDAAPAPQARFLIEAILRGRELRQARPMPQWWRIGARMSLMVEMLASFAEGEVKRPPRRRRSHDAPLARRAGT